jgi:cytochrome P450
VAPADRQVRKYPNTPAGQLEPNPLLEELRTTEPVSRVQPEFGGEAWLVTRHADVKAVFADPRFSRAKAITEDVPRATPFAPPPNSIMSMDPPEHSRLRRLVGKAFTGARIEKLRPRVQEITDELLDRVVERGDPADLVEHFCFPLPATVICELYGVPRQNQAEFQGWSNAFVSTNKVTLEEIISANMKLSEYLAGLIGERRRNPGEDLLSALVHARDDEGQLTEEELILLAATILAAGYESTAGMLSNFIYLLLTRPEERDKLRGRPDLVPSAIEEMLRYSPVIAGAGFARVATEDVELSGTTIRAGQAVLPSDAAANRDESVFGATFNTLDFERQPNPHLAFGHGAHYCLGSQLGRMELQIGITSVLDRFPNLRLAVDPAELPWKQGMLSHGVLRLPVNWSDSTGG